MPTEVQPHSSNMNGIPRAKLATAAVIEIDTANSATKSALSVVKTARKAFNTQRTKFYEFRYKQLKNLQRFFKEQKEALCKALYEDLRKAYAETINYEIVIVESEIKNVLNNLKSWMKPDSVNKSLLNFFDGVKIYNDPYGVVLVIGAWNFPIYVLLLPVVGAIAAGNCVVIKPSECAPATAEVIAKHLPKYLDNECYPVYLGGIEETTELLKQRFDYIFFTGSTQVGKIVYQAATKHLTPVTLELGGKSPVYIDNTANLRIAAKRIIWGKTQNSGQICIAPDYVLCSKEIQEKFVKYIKEALNEFYGGDIKSSESFGRIVNQKNFTRLANLLKNQKVAIGGEQDAKDLFVHPTVLIDVRPDDPIMQEEIFGPILPIVTVESYENAIDFIKEREKPLALYIFTKNSRVKKAFLEKTSSGAVVINDVIMHVVTEGLPFGGVGYSGMGAYHGKYSFDLFVHKKAVLLRGYNLLADKLESMRYPPYTDFKTNAMSNTFKRNITLPVFNIGYFLMFLLGVLITIAVYYLTMCVFKKE